jgi:hypothetical protein
MSLETTFLLSEWQLSGRAGHRLIHIYRFVSYTYKHVGMIGISFAHNNFRNSCLAGGFVRLGNLRNEKLNK